MEPPPLWYTTFPWKQVVPERHEQLLRALQDSFLLPERIYHNLLVQYQHLRQTVFWLLSTFAEAPDFLKQVTQQVCPVLNEQDGAWWDELMTDGEALILEANGGRAEDVA